MLTFIKLDATRILYGNLLLKKHTSNSIDRVIEFVGLTDNVDRFISDEDDSIWYGLCAVSVTLPRPESNGE